MSRQIEEGETGRLRFPFHVVYSKSFVGSASAVKREMCAWATKEFQQMKSALGTRATDYEQELLESAIAVKEEETFKAVVLARRNSHDARKKKGERDGHGGKVAGSGAGAKAGAKGLKERHKNKPREGEGGAHKEEALAVADDQMGRLPPSHAIPCPH